ncbi:hypothetical protein GCM10027037_13310 [Mucilaginibacter koreensis]
MTINYQTQLNNHRASPKNSALTLEPLTLEQVEQLEQQYNGGKNFPAALRELLYLAGQYCYVVDTGLNETQQEMQEHVRALMIDPEYEYYCSIPRPFYIFEVLDGGEQFQFVYLDENQEDPVIHVAELYENRDGNPWIKKLNFTLSQVINERVSRMLRGESPY